MRVTLVLSVLFAIGYAAPQGGQYLPPSTGSADLSPVIHKKFYIISAPEDHSNDGKIKNLVIGKPQKNYRVVFIKAPVGDNDGVKYAVEPAPIEEKTVVYVLTKKDKELNADDIATPAPSQPSKPEVFFIKYKTEEEAQHAQSQIQSEYDKLGGTNEVSNEGEAPLTSVVGSLDGTHTDGSYNYRPVSSGSANLAQPLQPPSTSYLPSIFKK